ncbi:MAG TPA: thiamine pyrophosphate-dependent enzyme, partial [Ktedonobacterales bacterium]
HTTSDDPTRYRTDADVAPWRDDGKDPIARAAARLRARGAWDDAFGQQVQAEADERAGAMRAALLAAQPGHPARIFDQVFEHMPDSLTRERDELTAALAPEAAPGGEA